MMQTIPTTNTMLSAIHDRHTLLASMHAADTLLITPNNRLANELLHEHALAYHADTAYAKPPCISYQTWRRQLYDEQRYQQPQKHHPIVLSSQQQRHLWREIIESTTETPAQEGLLHEVLTAWERQQAWQMPENHADFLQNIQLAQFQQWCQRLRQRLSELHAITEAQLINELLPSLDRTPWQTIIWVCFDDYTPEQQALQRALAALGCKQMAYDLAHTPGSSQRFAARDELDEQSQMLAWVEQQLAKGHTRIGIIVPELQQQAKSLSRLFSGRFTQDQYNMSLGEPLTAHPLVTHALAWLELDKKNISHALMRLLLQSPYLSGAQQEFSARSQLMQTSPLMQEPFVSWSQFLNTCQHHCPLLAQVLAPLPDYPKTATITDWVTQFRERLAWLHFPGDVLLTSTSYQYFQRLLALFDEWLQLAFITPTMTQHQAITALRLMAQETIFQVQTPKAPIQILGLLEASGCQFDCIWMMGLTDRLLPAPTRLSAFLPMAWQRNFAMPHALPERELAFAQRMLQRFTSAAGACVFSYASFHQDTPQQASPLIQNLAPYVPLIQATPEPPCLIAYEESYQLPIPDPSTIRGGTHLLANQAKCPFRAFAAHRLHAVHAPEITLGLSARERGLLLHRVLEILWQQLGSQKNLRIQTPDVLEKLIDTSIQQALKPLSYQRPLALPKLIQALELARLRSLIRQSLLWEETRPEFTVVALEQAYSLTLSGITFQVRVDRIDQVEQNQWVIDYKSRLPDSTPWHSERPEEPQLLLYALLDTKITTLMWLELKANRITCRGVSEQKIPCSGIQALTTEATWHEYQQRWYQTLSELAAEFVAGHCPPRPIRNTTCQHCEFKNLCRI